jgi:hypothetical protein
MGNWIEMQEMLSRPEMMISFLGASVGTEERYNMSLELTTLESFF